MNKAEINLFYSSGLFFSKTQFKVDRLQIILVAKNIYIYVLQLFISRMPKMYTIYNSIENF